MTKKIAFSVNWDSFNAAFQFPKDYVDPTNSVVAERFLAFARRYSFRYSFYVIGKDLEKPEARAAVRHWAEEGHEIGNHSWSHPNDLGAMSYNAIEAQVKQAHEIITTSVGKPPVGFVAPGWSSSPNLLRVLITLGYEYDTSTFSSPLMYMAVAQMIFTNKRPHNQSVWRLIKRADYFANLFSPRHAYFTQGSLVRTVPPHTPNSMLVIPLPTTRWRMPLWHTVGFMLGWTRYLAWLRAYLQTHDTFYYLLHPADLATNADANSDQPTYMSRMDTSLDEKMTRFEQVLRLFNEFNVDFVTMQELAQHLRQQMR